MENKHDCDTGSPKAAGSPELQRERSRSPPQAISGGAAAVGSGPSQPASASYWPLIVIPDDHHYGHQLPVVNPEGAVAEEDPLVRRTCSVCKKLFDSPKAMWGHSWVHRDRTSSKDTHHGMATPPRGGSGLTIQVGAAGSGFFGSGGGENPWVGFGEGGGDQQQSNKSNYWTIDSQDVRDRTCPRCQRVFHSPKAMYGHLHVHKRSKDEGGSGEGMGFLIDLVDEDDVEEGVNEENEIRAVEAREVPVTDGGGKGKEKLGEAKVVKGGDGRATGETSKIEDETSGGDKGSTDDSSGSIDLNKPAGRGRSRDDNDSPDSIDLNRTPSCN